jgi:hypothetical protein
LWAFTVLYEAELWVDGSPNGFAMAGQKLACALCAGMQCNIATPGSCNAFQEPFTANVRTYGINENFCFGKFFIALTNSLISP